MARIAPAIQKRHVEAPQPVDDRCLAVDGRAPIALVVDDEPLVRRFVSTVLRRQGWLVREAGDAVGALALAATGPLDLLVTDYEMPGISGVALAVQLRLRNENLPVLMVSGYPDAAGEMRSLNGRTAFARKPFEAMELVASICSILS
jgi:DNA-binding response OmpR family regulator